MLNLLIYVISLKKKGISLKILNFYLFKYYFCTNKVVLLIIKGVL